MSLDAALLTKLGVSPDNYAEREYLRPPARTQEIGATINFLEIDGFFAPSARYSTQNLMILHDNFVAQGGRVNVISSERFDWKAYADL